MVYLGSSRGRAFSEAAPDPQLSACHPTTSRVTSHNSRAHRVLALPRFSGALRRVLATSIFNAALIVEGELGLLSRGFSAHISAQRLVRLLKSESVME